MKSPKLWKEIFYRLAAILLAFLFTTVILLAAGAPPFQAFGYILLGAFGSLLKISDIIISWVPLLLVTSGVLLTFTAGLWNIGVEGQITIGAIFTTLALRAFQETSLPSAIILLISLIAGIFGGAIWGSLIGFLKTFGGVNEIFGGLGMNFVATALTIWLIFGPWKRPGTGSMSGTLPFDERFWLPNINGTRLTPLSFFIALIVLALVYLILKNTFFGLKLKAVGKNFLAAHLMGIAPGKYMMLSFILCGALAGIAGWVQVVGVYHRLIPSISSGYGFLGLLAAMLTNFQVIWSLPVTFFFAALNIGSIQLPIVLKLDSTLSGILQGALVLSVLFMDGLRGVIGKKVEERIE